MRLLMAASDLYRDCFWCGLVYDIHIQECCPACGSRLETDGHIGPLAGEYNRRPDYNGPEFTAWLEQRQEDNGSLFGF
jgi:hypothetical protein